VNRNRDSSQDALYALIKRVASQSAVYGLFDVIGKASYFLLVPLYTRSMSRAEYGRLEILTVTSAFLLVVTVLGFNSALVRYYTPSLAPADRRSYFRTALSTVALSSLLAVLPLIALAAPISRLLSGGSDLAWAWRLVFAGVGLDSLSAIGLALFRSQERPYRYSWVSLGRLALVLVLNIILVGVMKRGLPGVVIGNFIGSLAGAVVALALAAADLGWEIRRPRFADLARFGLPLVWSGLAMNVVNMSDRYFLRAYASLTDVGTYALTYKVGMIMSVMVNAFVVAYPPLMFRIKDDPGAARVFGRILTYYSLVTAAILLAVGGFSRELVLVLGGRQYAGAAGPVWLILTAYLLQGAQYFFSTGVAVTDRTRWIPVVVVSAAAVNIAANFLLIPRFGIWGAAWATVTAFGAMAAGMRLASERHYRIPLETGRLLRLGATAAVTFLVVLAAGRVPGPAAPLLKLAGLLIFPVGLWISGFFSGEEKLRARQFLDRRFRRP
jgi:O-antigen/teichoic acid export membrane protein